MNTAQAYPLQWPNGWPRTHRSAQKSSRFKTEYSRACEKLQTELRGMKARNIVVSSNLPISRNGVPYSEAAKKRIDDAGVAVYFLWKGKSHSMARDEYYTVHENIMSLSHAIGHMRGLSRHGGDHMMTQAFAGFAALPAPENSKPSRPWFEVLGLPPDCNDRDMIEAAFKVKMKKAHPDLGGSSEAVYELTEAKADALR
jgi:hypothetical protein